MSVRLVTHAITVVISFVEWWGQAAAARYDRLFAAYSSSNARRREQAILR